MKTLPIMLQVHGRVAVVVGAGSVGMRRVRTLHEAGARVVLVARELPDSLPSADVTVLHGPYHRDALAGAALVFACTDDTELNRQISRDARRIGALVNAADQPEDCDFFVPAVVTDGEVQIAIGTSGASPGLAGRLKRRMAEALPERIGEYAALLARLRDELKGRVADVAGRGRIMKELAGEETYKEFLSAGPERVREDLDRLLKP